MESKWIALTDLSVAQYACITTPTADAAEANEMTASRKT